MKVNRKRLFRAMILGYLLFADVVHHFSEEGGDMYFADPRDIKRFYKFECTFEKKEKPQ